MISYLNGNIILKRDKFIILLLRVLLNCQACQRGVGVVIASSLLPVMIVMIVMIAMIVI